MPKYKITLKQGSRTLTNVYEFKNLRSAKEFFTILTTFQISEIWEEKYINSEIIKSIDDPEKYCSFAKVLILNKKRDGIQLFIPHLRMNIDKIKLYKIIKDKCLIGGDTVTDYINLLIKN